MQSFKYSQKPKQTIVKKHKIFDHEIDREKMSLQVHECLPGVAHLVEQSKIEEQSSGFAGDHPATDEQYLNSPHPQEQENRTVKFTRNRQRKGGISGRKPGNDLHAISVTAKVKTPEISQRMDQHTMGSWDGAGQRGAAEDLLMLKGLLINNEQRLVRLMDFVNSICQSTINLYTTHEQKLLQLVNSRCYEIVKIYKSAILTLKIHDKKLTEVDNHITLLFNTLKDSKQSLRLTKIKQQCIEALQKTQLPFRELSESKTNMRQKNKEKPQREIKPQPSIVTSNKIDKKVEWKRTSPINKESQKYLESSQSIEMFYDNPPSSLITLKEDYKMSPFDANQMLINSPTTINPTKTEPWTNFSEYSFRKPKTSALQTDPWPQKAKQRITQSLDKFDQMRAKLQEVLRQFEKNQVWLDDLNCLRFENGAYVLDDEGNAFICSPEQFRKLILAKVISHRQFTI